MQDPLAQQLLQSVHNLLEQEKEAKRKLRNKRKSARKRDKK
jgi:hypothetical protein